MPVGSLTYKDVNTPQGFCEKLLGIKFNSGVPEYPTKLVSNTKGTLAEYCDPAELQRLTRGVEYYTVAGNNYPLLLQVLRQCVCENSFFTNGGMTADYKKFDPETLWDFFSDCHSQVRKFCIRLTKGEALVGVIAGKEEELEKELDKLCDRLKSWQRQAPKPASEDD